MCFVGGTNGGSQSVSSFFFHPARFSFLLVVPVVKLLRRTGHHSAWSTFAVFPGLNLIAFWYFAFNPGPPMQSRRMPSTSSHFSGIPTSWELSRNSNRISLSQPLIATNYCSTTVSTFFSVSAHQQLGSKLLPRSKPRKTGVVHCAATSVQSISRGTRRESNQVEGTPLRASRRC